MDRRTLNRNAPRIVGLVFFGIGIILLAVAVVTGISARNFVNSAEGATGVVIDNDTSRDEDGDITYFPIIRFLTQDGEDITFRSDIGTGNERTLGSSVDVLYKTDDPSDALLDGFVEKWFLPLLFGFMGVIFTVIGLATVVAVSQARRRSDERIEVSDPLIQDTVRKSTPQDAVIGSTPQDEEIDSSTYDGDR